MQMQPEGGTSVSELPISNAYYHKNKIGKRFLCVSYALNVIIIVLMVVMGSMYWIIFPKKCSGYIEDLGNTFSLEMVFGGNARQFTVFIKQLAAWGLTQLDATEPRNERSFFFGDGESVIVCRFLIQIPKDGGKYNLPVK